MAGLTIVGVFQLDMFLREKRKQFEGQSFVALYQDPSSYQEIRETHKEGNANPALMFWLIHSLGICMSNYNLLLPLLP